MKSPQELAGSMFESASKTKHDYEGYRAIDVVHVLKAVEKLVTTLETISRVSPQSYSNFIALEALAYWKGEL